MSAVLDPSAISPAVVAASGRFFRIPPNGPVQVVATWAEYLWLDARRDEVGSKTKLTYHCGQLELRTHSFRTGNLSRRLAMFVLAVAVSWNVRLKTTGGTTILRPDLEISAEPDESFYIQNLDGVAGFYELDHTIHPSPDLVIDLERSPSSLDPRPVYAALGVPELWRFADDEVTFLARDGNNDYRAQPISRAFPAVTSAAATRLAFAEVDDDTAYYQRLMDWTKSLNPTA